MRIYFQGFVTGGKDGTVKLCDETFTKIHKTYKLSQENLLPNQMLSSATPSIRSVVLGKGKILASTNSGEIMELNTEGQINVLVQVLSSSIVVILRLRLIFYRVTAKGNYGVWRFIPQRIYVQRFRMMASL